MSAPPQRRRAVVTFALADEGKAFCRRLANPRRGRGALAPITGDCAGWAVTVAFTGVGAGADCRERLAAALRESPEWLLSSGFAGGLRGDLRVGDLVLGVNHSDPALAERAGGWLAGARFYAGALTTQPRLAETVAAKAALADATGALAVDMETGWIAAACAAAGVPMLSLRVISDAADQPMPAPGDILFDVARQRPRYVALPWWLLRRPRQAAPFARFVRGLGPARERLAVALHRLLAEMAETAP